MTLDESAHEDNDLVEEIDGLRFLYEKGIAAHLTGKTIDYHTGIHEGFSITSDDPDPCSGCSCD